MSRNAAYEVLFPAKGRRKVLELLFVEHASGSASELARRARITPRAASLILADLERAQFVVREGVGGAHIFKPAANKRAAALSRFLTSLGDRSEERTANEDEEFDAAVAFHGAPLLREPARPSKPLEATLAYGAKRARKDPTLLRTLPLLVATNRHRIDWDSLRDLAVRADSKAETGFLLDMTAELLPDEELSAHAKSFLDRRRTRFEFFFEPRNQYDERMAHERTPEVARRWKFLMNMDLDSIRSTMERFATPPSP